MSKEIEGSNDSIIGLTEIKENKLLWRMLVAELIGTLLLVLIGCGSILHVDDGEKNIVQIALTFGLTVSTIVQSICHLSGGHLNPAVSLSLFVAGHIKLTRAILFIVVQLVGAICGAAILKSVTPSEKEGDLGITDLGPKVTHLQGFLMEAVLTFLLLIVIHGVCDSHRKDVRGSSPLAIGLAVTACHLCGIPYTGSSLNPARSFGPAVVMNLWSNHWVYWAGPIIGGLCAGLTYRFVLRVERGKSDSYDF